MTPIVRPARAADLPRLGAMIADVDKGMLTMPSTLDAMAERVARSQTAFLRASAPPENECYFLVMETGGDLVGTAGVFTNLGVERPFYSYRITRDSKVSPEQNVKVELDLLNLFNGTPGLISDKLKGVLEFVWQVLQGAGRRGIVFAYDEAQNLDDVAKKDQFPLSLLLDVFQSIQRVSPVPLRFHKVIRAGERNAQRRLFDQGHGIVGAEPLTTSLEHVALMRDGARHQRGL